MQLLIPAAGMGVRLGGTADHPVSKLLLPVLGQPLISHILQMASAVAEFSRIIVVLGPDYETAFRTIRNVASGILWNSDTEVVCVKNSNYKSTNVAYSLYLVRRYLEGDVVIHNGDVLVTPALFEKLVIRRRRIQRSNDSIGAWVLAEKTSTIPEYQTKIVADDKGVVIEIGKTVSSGPNGLYMDLCCLTSQATSIFRDELCTFVRRGQLNAFYSEALNGLASRLLLGTVWSEGLPWFELDKTQDLERLSLVAPEIVRQISRRKLGSVAKVTSVDGSTLQ